MSEPVIPERWEREAKEIVTRIVTNAIAGQWTRNLELWVEGCTEEEAPTEQQLMDDALSLALGYDTGCLDDEEFDERVDALWLGRKLSAWGAAEAKVAELESEVTRLNNRYEMEHTIAETLRCSVLASKTESAEQAATIAALELRLSDQHATIVRDAATIERLERELRTSTEPDMFWDADDAERCEDSIREIVYDCGLQVTKIATATHGPTFFAFLTGDPSPNTPANQ
jgi:hypothetical protein